MTPRRRCRLLPPLLLLCSAGAWSSTAGSASAFVSDSLPMTGRPTGAAARWMPMPMPPTTTTTPFAPNDNAVGRALLLLLSEASASSEGAAEAAAAASAAPGGMSDAEKEALATAQIAEMIEATFVRACLQLAAGYVDVLKLFVVSVKTGYECGIATAQLIRAIEECPVNSAGRDLMVEEKALRDSWIDVIYMTLEADTHATEEGVDAEEVGRSVGEENRDKFGAVVADVVSARRSFEERAAPTFEEASAAHPELLGDNGNADAVAVAVATQSLRVADLTITVIDEERLANEDGGGGAGPAPKQARPPIPGAFTD